MKRVAIGVVIGFCAIAFGVRSAVTAEPEPSFARDIKPILAGKCFACHGPDEDKRQGELRLDIRAGALAGEAIVAGDSAKSALLARVSSADPDEFMPPPDSKKPRLTPGEIDLLKRWIDGGAKYDSHWSYVPPARTHPPVITDPQWKSWPRNAIDQYVLAAQLKRDLTPAPAADKRTLIRRLALDLTGLPPSPDDVEAFVNDASPDAYQKLVERMFQSPHYGERMAQLWLDLVRFADTGGYHSDNHRDITPYRDWVIAAFQTNMPFDRFTVEQLAGDLIPGATNDQRIASGYNRLLMTTEEGGAQAKEYVAKYQADRVRNVSSVWLGSTLGCAECHNHKFDPFTTKDFYSFAAFFADIQEQAVGRQPQTSVPSGARLKEIAALEARIAALQAQLLAPAAELDAAQTKWEATAIKDLQGAQAAWQVVRPTSAISLHKQTLTTQDDASVLASGENPAKDTYTVILPAEQETLTGLRLEALTHDSLTNKSLSRGNGNFVLTEIEVAYIGPDDPGEKPVRLIKPQADFEQNGHPLANAIDGKKNTGWAVAGHEKAAPHAAAFKFGKSVSGAPGGKIIVKLAHDSQYAQHNIGRFRLALTSVAEPSLTTPSGIPTDVAAALSKEPAQRSPEQAALVKAYYRSVAPELGNTRTEIAALGEQKKKLEAGSQTLVSMSGAPRTVRILPRGNWLDESGEVVEPAIPAFLGPWNVKGRRATRLDLAEWLVSPEHPLTARVFVNRLWKVMYGHGLARNLEDYGTQGSYPTHPELLDYLAVELRESGWNVQHVLKLMALSATYQQSSSVPAAQRAKDPLNDWWARQDRYRIDGEFVRDTALAASGLLSRKIGGASVKPYQPDGYWQFLNFPTRTYVHDKGEDLYRRGLYTYWQRSFLNPSLLAFDVPSREECTNERPRSNTPLQALALLNDPTYVDAARALAVRMVKEGGSAPADKIDFAFRRAVARPASASEVKLLAELYERHRAAYQGDAAQAAAALAGGEGLSLAGLNPAEVAAWMSVARVILNLHETVTRS